MSYQFNPHRHVKIWVSRDRDIFLNLENQLRLIRMRAENPDDEISLVFVREALSEQALEELHHFCQAHNIIPKSYDEAIKPFVQGVTEGKLIECIDYELANLKKGGNPGAISDMLRWLSPVCSLGVYTDFDVRVTAKDLPSRMDVKSPLLLSIGSSTFGTGNYEQLFFNNDTVAVVHPEHAESKLALIQQTMVNAYQSKSFFYEQFSLKAKDNLQRVSPGIFILLQGKIEEEGAILKALDTKRKYLVGPNDPVALRNALMNDKARGLSWYCQEVIATAQSVMTFGRGLSFGLSESETIKKAASIIRERIKEKVNWLNWLITPTPLYAKLKKRLVMTDRELCETEFNDFYTMLIRESVVNSTGPKAITNALFESMYLPTDRIKAEIEPLTFEGNGIISGFNSLNRLKLHSSPNEAAKIVTAEAFTLCDISWLDIGINAQKNRETKMLAASEAIQGFFKTEKKRKAKTLPAQLKSLKNQIKEHREKIQSDLNGCFGFYRKGARLAKIEALGSLLEVLADDTFNVESFKEKVEALKSREVDACLFGVSHARAFIDKLELYARQAQALSLVNEGELQVAKLNKT